MEQALYLSSKTSATMDFPKDILGAQPLAAIRWKATTGTTTGGRGNTSRGEYSRTRDLEQLVIGGRADGERISIEPSLGHP